MSQCFARIIDDSLKFRCSSRSESHFNVDNCIYSVMKLRLVKAVRVGK